MVFIVFFICFFLSSLPFRPGSQANVKTFHGEMIGEKENGTLMYPRRETPFTQGPPGRKGKTKK